MGSRCRSIAKSSYSIFKFTVNKPTLKPNSLPSLPSTPSSFKCSRSFPQLGAIQSLLPLHSAVSSARLTSCLGIDSTSSRSLSQELGLSVPR
ncbi:protein NONRESPONDING TO OXYLIPINS 2, mitochondrial isoform X2 [Mercurialis annua]|uniref:protein NONRESPONDING TO OXYLIPINS 2, mitochondrial isoform X2 n=1 Tax=Mercurialis annua TaxID=3986 RepID=UPI00215FC5E3|nr:protein NONRESPONDING TO OXYLIPINS 2, mitochondrial isoform X2 [Mercurialis annua]